MPTTTPTDIWAAGVPTHREILKIIEMLRNLFKEFLAIFEEIIANFKLDYGTYTRTITDTDN
jgi:hypothetical protein